MADQTQRLEIATVKAEVGSNILFRFANDAAETAAIPTDSGSIQNLKQVIAEIQEDGAEKISIATTIYQSAAAGLAATADGGIYLVQSSDADEIYTVWKNEAGAAVNTGKTAMSSQAIQDALTASNEAAQAAEDAADVATNRTAGFLQPAAEEPTIRDDGLPLQVGDRYFNTENETEYLYKDSGWTANDSLAAIADLKDPDNPAKGASLVGYDGVTVAELLGQSRPLANYNALRNYSGNASIIRITQSGLAGYFSPDPNDSISIDDGGCVIIDETGIRWKRVFSGNVQAVWFGVKTSTSQNFSLASSNLVAINKASKFVFSQFGGGVLEFPGGSIPERRIDGATDPEQQYLIARSYVKFKGQGIDVTNIVRLGPQTIFYQTTNQVNALFAVEDMTLDGNPSIAGYTNYAASLVYVTLCDSPRFVRVKFKDTPGLHAIDYNGSNSGLAQHCEFLGHDADLTVVAGGAAYSPESIQVGKEDASGTISDGLTVEYCIWGPSENLPAPLNGVGNHTSGASGQCAKNVTVRYNRDVKGLRDTFVRAYAFDNTEVIGNRLQESTAIFFMMTGSGVSANSIATRALIEENYSDADNIFVYTNPNVSAYNSALRYSDTIIRKNEVVGRTAYNAIALYFAKDALITDNKIRGARRSVLSQWSQGTRIRDNDFDDHAVSGIEFSDGTGENSGKLLGSGAVISGGTCTNSDYYAINCTALSDYLIEDIDVSGASRLAPTRHSVVISGGSKNGTIRRLWGRKNENANAPINGVNITSGANHITEDIDIYCTGAMVANFGTGRSYSLREVISANGSPEGVYAADKGQLFARLDGVAGGRLYLKTTDADDTGWDAIA